MKLQILFALTLYRPALQCSAAHRVNSAYDVLYQHFFIFKHVFAGILLCMNTTTETRRFVMKHSKAAMSLHS